MLQHIKNKSMISVKKTPEFHGISFSFQKSEMHRRLFLSSYSIHYGEIFDCDDQRFADDKGSEKFKDFECAINLKSSPRKNDNNIVLNLDKKNNLGFHKRGEESLQFGRPPFMFLSVLSIFPRWSFCVPNLFFSSSKKKILYILIKLFVLGAKILQSLFFDPLNILLGMLFQTESLCAYSRDDAASKEFCSYIQDLCQSYPAKRCSELSKLFCPFVDFSLKRLITDITSQDINNVKNKNDSHNFITQPLILIYIHSPLHPDSTPFLRRTLLDPSLRSLLSSFNIIRCWGASVHSAEGRKIAHDLGVCGYPFLWVGRIITTKHDNVFVKSLETHFRLEGKCLALMPPSDLRFHLQTTLNKFHEMAEKKLKENRSQTEQRLLRIQQDHEYQLALQEDKRKELIKIQERKRIQDEIDHKHRIVENENKRKKELFYQAKIMLGKEPCICDGLVTKIRFTLPSGQRIDRSFYYTQTVNSLRVFLIVYWGSHDNNTNTNSSITNFELSCKFPMRSLEGKNNKTLQDEGLCPQAVIMVQNLDS